MSAHPTGEASTPVSAEAVQDFIADQFLGGSDEPSPEDEDEVPEGEKLEGNEDEAEEAESDDDEPTDEDGEAEEPIAAPVSWDKDAKELFTQLPRDLQAKVAEREAQRDKVVQSATTEAAHARKNAVAEANAMFADTQRHYASHLEHIASQFAPQRPDPALLAQDPQAFYQLQAHYEEQQAQRQTLTQQAAQAEAEAAQRDNLTRQHEVAETHRVMGEKLGDLWNDPTRRQALLTDLEKVGAELGYPADLIPQANTTDLLALRQALDWKVKASKWDQAQKDRMTAVRAAKGAPRVAKPGNSSNGAERSARGRDAAWNQLKASGGKSGDAALSVLQSMGIDI